MVVCYILKTEFLSNIILQPTEDSTFFRWCYFAIYWRVTIASFYVAICLFLKIASLIKPDLLAFINISSFQLPKVMGLIERPGFIWPHYQYTKSASTYGRLNAQLKRETCFFCRKKNLFFFFFFRSNNLVSRPRNLVYQKPCFLIFDLKNLVYQNR